MAVNFNPRALDAFWNLDLTAGTASRPSTPKVESRPFAITGVAFGCAFAPVTRNSASPSAKPAAPGHERGERQGRFLEEFHGVRWEPRETDGVTPKWDGKTWKCIS